VVGACSLLHVWSSGQLACRHTGCRVWAQEGAAAAAAAGPCCCQVQAAWNRNVQMPCSLYKLMHKGVGSRTGSSPTARQQAVAVRAPAEGIVLHWGGCCEQANVLCGCQVVPLPLLPHACLAAGPAGRLGGRSANSDSTPAVGTAARVCLVLPTATGHPGLVDQVARLGDGVGEMFWTGTGPLWLAACAQELCQPPNAPLASHITGAHAGYRWVCCCLTRHIAVVEREGLLMLVPGTCHGTGVVGS
jgi:hypothetical protein